MTTGVTGQLGLALPVQGELSGVWGNTVNNGITEYTNIAIAATLTLTNDGAVTLANTTGDASATNIVSSLTGAGTVTAQFAVVKIAGTLTTTKVVTGPSYSKTYVVDNAATGGAVTFKASGQSGVSVAVGEKCTVYYNGTDYVKIATSTSGTGTVTAVSVVSANGFAGTSSGGATPALTLSTSITGVLKGNGTAISAAVSGTDYAPATSGTSILYGNGSGGFSNVTIGSGISFAGGTLSSTGSGGTVTSVAVSGGTTGLTTSGGPITGSGTIILAGTLGAVNGGTGQSTYATGDLLYASAANTLSKLTIGVAGTVLSSDGTTVSWATASASGGASTGKVFFFSGFAS
jgi:hypothetical protein